MPELPEVETICRGISPYLVGQKIKHIVIRQTKLRWLVPAMILQKKLPQQLIQAIERRSKYILIKTTAGTLIIHLGMSGSLQIITANTSYNKHDHIDIITQTNICLRYRDPRRFGCVLWTTADYKVHRLIVNLGPEPLSAKFNGCYLFEIAKTKRVTIKQLIMNAKIVVGVGNIYASESLYAAKINPKTCVNQLSLNKYNILCQVIQQTLRAAIKVGGTTLRDFVNAHGKPGYFSQQLKVYNRAGQSCYNCGQMIKKIIIAQRSSFFCANCQI